MTSPTPPNALPDTLESALSHERFERYLSWTGGDRVRAIELYILNMQVSEALITPLQLLEVTLRNRIHSVMAAAFDDTWFDGDEIVLTDDQMQQLTDAKDKLTAEGKAPEPGRLVAEMTFSFWTTMLSPANEDLWRSTLHRIALNEDGKHVARKALSRPLGKFRMLRNRIAHHEPVLYWSLPKHHAEMVKIIRWMAPPIADLAVHASRFGHVWPFTGVHLIEE